MKPFSRLLDALSYQPQRNLKIRLLADYFSRVPDPDRGYGLAALTGVLEFAHAKPALLRSLVAERVDPELFAWSYDYVGDLAETISLIWPKGEANAPPHSLGEIVEALQHTSKTSLPGFIAAQLDRMSVIERFALLKLITGGLRVGVSARLAKTALAEWSGKALNEIEEVWHGLAPPFLDLFAWLEGRAGPPKAKGKTRFRPVMLAHPLDEADLALLDPAEFMAEWKWDGIRVQLVCENGERRMFSRTGDDISNAFPDVLEHAPDNVVIDGELLIMREGKVQSFAELQQRLNRKEVTSRMIEERPAGIIAYDLLLDGTEDLRARALQERRSLLEGFVVRRGSPRLTISPLVAFATWEELAAKRAAGAEDGAPVEGLMLKRRDSRYEAGRITGLWYKWKRDPHLIDAVMMYAQRGHGKRSSFYSDYTFGVWRGEGHDRELVPVGKAYFGFTDEELKEIDRFVRNNTVGRFGPVREVVHEDERGLVLEVAFEGLQRSTRHKSGIAMRFPRISRLRWDKPPREADTIDALEKLLEVQRPMAEASASEGSN
ncbi:MAG: cisplatin damage response ATP-dependent DNA ligase [Alphaproteobacteria bacterium]